MSQTLVGHLRGGLAQVVTLFSMFFAGISGSSVADVAVLSRTVAPEMDKEGYDRAFTAALIASASTMANLIPPSIMAVVYGATGNVSIGGLFLAGVVPGVHDRLRPDGVQLFLGAGRREKEARPVHRSGGRGARRALPLMIPVIIMGGILTGWFTPTEAGMVAAVYIPRRADPGAATEARQGTAARLHVRRAGLIFSLPLITIGAANAFGWMLAYLRGPDHRRRLHHRHRRQRSAG